MMCRNVFIQSLKRNLYSKTNRGMMEKRIEGI